MRFRLTKTAKVLISLILAIVVVIGVVFGLKSGLIKNDIKDKKVDKEVNSVLDNTEATEDPDTVMTTDKKSASTINVSLDEWIGWKSIIDANGGLTTQKGSIYDQLGIDVNISVINDATQSSNALIKGDLDAAGYTVNRTAFLSTKFKEAGIDVIMPYITNYSNGGDGIIAKSEIKNVKDLVNAKIGVPEFSEAQTLVVWFVNNSDLSDKEKKDIIKRQEKVAKNFRKISNAMAIDSKKAEAKAKKDVASSKKKYKVEDVTDTKLDSAPDFSDNNSSLF